MPASTRCLLVGISTTFIFGCASPPIERSQQAIKNDEYQSVGMHGSNIHDLIITRLFVSKNYLSGKQMCQWQEATPVATINDGSWHFILQQRSCSDENMQQEQTGFISNIQEGASHLQDVVKSLLGSGIPDLEATITVIPEDYEYRDDEYLFSSRKIRLAYAFHRPSPKAQNSVSRAYIDLGTLAHEYFHMYLARNNIEFPNLVSEETAASLFARCITVSLPHVSGVDGEFDLDIPKVSKKILRETAKSAPLERQSLLGGIFANRLIVSALGKARVDTANEADRDTLKQVFLRFLRERTNALQ